MPEEPWYVIMDERAYYDVDAALIKAADGKRLPLRLVQQERDRDWPGCPIVDITRNELVEE